MNHVSTVDTHRADACETLTGNYTGNGVNGRNIDIGVNLAAKSNATVVIKSTASDAAVFRTNHVGDDSSYFIGAPNVANLIQLFNSTGFEIGDNSHVNADGVVYRYIVFWTEP